MQRLNVSIETWFKVNDELIFPILVDIADIREYDNKSEKLKIDIIRKDFRVNKLDSPFKSLYDEWELKQNMLYYLSFIDSRPLFEGQSFIEYTYDVKTTEELLDKLIELGVQKDTFIYMKNEIEYYINRVKSQFINRAKEVLDYDRNFHTLVLKEETPKDIAIQMSYAPSMSVFQSPMEYTSAVIFPENVGKSYMEYSWREINFKVMYISMKNKIEGFITRHQQWKVEQTRNTDK